MQSPRFVADIASDRASLVASSTSGARSVANLQTDTKYGVWRATGTTASITLTWSAPEVISCAVLAFCNLAPTDTMRVRGWSDAGGTNLVLDTGAAAACPAPAVKLRGLTAAQAASAYAQGGGAYARCWFERVTVRKVVIDIDSAANLQGYIEAARLIVADYWTTSHHADRGASMTLQDTAAPYRTAAGDELVDAGFRFREVQMQLSMLPLDDRAALTDLLRSCGRTFPLLVSMFPGSADLALERDHFIYGRLSEASAIALPSAGYCSAPIRINEI